MLSETLAVDGIDLTQTSHEEQLQMRNLMKYESCLAFYNLNRNHISLSLSLYTEHYKIPLLSRHSKVTQLTRNRRRRL